MSELCLTFTTEAAAILGQKTIWVNQVKAEAAKGNNLVGDGVRSYSAADLSTMTFQEISELFIYSAVLGDVSPNLPRTTEYAEVKKAYELEKWYFLKPPDQCMTGVVGYAIEEFNPNWLPPDIR